MTYIFDNLNGGAEIVDPVITYPTLLSWDRVTKNAVVIAVLETPNGSKFSVELPINLPTVNGAQMDAKGALAIKAFEV